jgi:iron complex outermembrane receptor protein
MTMKAILSLLASSASAAVFAAATPAMAQQPSGAAPASGQVSVTDIIVQARRRDERLQDVPVSVAVTTPATLQQNNITSVADLSRVNPSLVAAPGLGSGRAYPVFAIRGQSQQEFTLLADPSVPVYLGDVVAARTQGVNGAIFDVSAVEVLRGAQGTLFGRNSTGGAIVIRPNKPTNEFEAEAGVTVGSRDMFNVDAMINVPLNDYVQLRVAGASKKDDGFVYDEILKRNINDTDQQAARISLRFYDPNSEVESLTTYDYFHENDGGTGTFLANLVLPAGAGSRITDAYGAPRNYTSFSTLLAQQRARGIYRIASGVNVFNKIETHTVQNATTIPISDWLTFKNILGYRHVKSHAVDDYDGTSNAVQQGERFDYTGQFTEEMQLFGDIGRLKYIAGAYFFWERGRNQGLSAAGAVDPGLVESGNVLDYPVLDARTLSNTDVAATNKSYAVFGQLDYEVVDGLTLTGGIRFNTDKRSIIARNRFMQNSDPDSRFLCRFSRDLDNNPATPETPAANLTEAQCIVKADAKFSKPTYNLSAQYKFNKDALLYVAHRRGYRTGGFAARAGTEAGLRQTFNPEFVDDFEVGFKGDWHPGNMFLRTNLTAYYSKYKDLQRAISQVPAAGGPLTTVAVNVGKARIWGIEADVLLRPVKQLELTANYAYTNAKYIEFVVNGVDRSNDPFARAPRNVYTLGARFTPEMGSNLGELSIGGNFFHTDGYNGLEDYLPGYSEVKGYSLVNADVGLSNVMESGVDLRVFVTNLTNKRYQLQAFPAVLGFSVNSPGTPRTIGVTGRIRF